MYVGHFGLALLGKGLRPQVPLWLLLAAAFALDVVEVGLQLSGGGGLRGLWSVAGPLAVLASGVLALGYYAFHADLLGAGVLALLAVSHLAADALTGQMRLWPGGPVAGLHLYEVPLLDLLLEGLVLLLGWRCYRRTLSRSRRHTRLALAIPLGLVILQLAFALRAGIAGGALPLMRLLNGLW